MSVSDLKAASMLVYHHNTLLRWADTRPRLAKRGHVVDAWACRDGERIMEEDYIQNAFLHGVLNEEV